MEITDIINQIYRLPSKLSLELFVSHTQEMEYPKRFRLFQEGRKERKVYFIKRGIARAYAHNGNKEVTFWLGKEGSIMSPLQTLYFGTGVYETLELLEDSTLYEIKLEQLCNLYETDIHLATWGRKYAEHACIQSEKMFIARQFKTSVERYQELIAEFPDIIQRVPLGIIASYLGITQVNLSRIRAKIR